MTAFEHLPQAVLRVQDGMTLALGGMTLYRRPVGFVLGLLARQPRPSNLGVLTFTGGYETDLLIGAGCVSTVRSVYVGFEAFGLAPMFTQAAQRGTLRVIEETEASIVLGLRARSSGVGFMPSTAWVGTDLPTLRPDVQQIADPTTREPLTAFPAIQIDVAVLHGLAADRQGNVLLNNNLGIDLELVYAADQVIVTVEQLVDDLTRDANGTIVPAPGVDVVVLLPSGAWPTSCYPYYAFDGQRIMAYGEACAAGAFAAYVAAML